MKRRTIICFLLILVFSAGIALGAWQIYRQLHEYAAGDKAYSGLEAYVEPPQEPEQTEVPQGPETVEVPLISLEPEAEAPSRQWPEVDFEALREINSDLVAWITIDGTNVNYPVVQGADNEYYLTHLFTGEWNNSGCIFLDVRNGGDFSDPNSILYGHHRKDGSMFHQLMEYKNQQYYEAHPTALLLTPEANYEVEFFAGYVADVDTHADAWNIGFSSEAEFEAWLRAAKERSCFVSGVTPGVTDRILTLSTCSYEFENARFVLLGVLRQDPQQE